MVEEHEMVIDTRIREQKRAAMERLADAEGVIVFGMRPYKPTRSNQANRRYFGAIIPTFQRFLRRHGQYFDKDQVHQFFLQMFASVTVVDPATGEVLSVIGKRSSKMDVEEFSRFTNDCEGYMLDKFNLTIDDPEYAKVEA